MVRASFGLPFATCALAVVVLLHTAATSSAMRTSDSSGDELEAPRKRRSAHKGKTAATVASAPLVAPSKGYPEKFAKELVARLKEEGTAKVNAEGPSASYMAVKAMMIANKKLAKELRGNVLALTPSKPKLENKRKKGQEAAGYLLEVHAVPKVTGAKTPDAISTNSTKVSRLAGVISRRFKKHDMITVGAMGRKALYSSLLATANAQERMAQEHGADKSKLALVPSMEEFKNGGEKMTRMQLACVRAPANVGGVAALGASQPLIAPNKGTPAAFAGVMVARLKEEGTAQISAVGQSASYLTIKAVLVANKDMAGQLRGKVLAVTPSKQPTSQKGQESMGYLFEVRAVPKVVVAKDVDIMSTNSSKVNRLAGSISRRFKKHNMVTMGAVGGKAVYRALRAAVSVQERMAQDQGADKSKLALVPSMVEFKSDGEKMSRMQLAFIRVPASLGKVAAGDKLPAGGKGAANQAKNPPLKATSKGNPGVFAGALAARMKEGRTAQMTAVGSAASCMALKATIIANTYLANETRGKVLAVTPSRHAVTLRKGQESVGYLLEVRVVPNVSVAKEPDTIVTNSTSSGRLGRFMARFLKKHDMLTVSAIGAKSVYRVLKAAANVQEKMAKGKTDQTKKKSKRTPTIALVPSFVEFEKDGVTLQRMQMACVRA